MNMGIQAVKMSDGSWAHDLVLTQYEGHEIRLACPDLETAERVGRNICDACEETLELVEFGNDSNGPKEETHMQTNTAPATVRIGTRAVLTTDHPASSHGIPVLILDDDGRALGPLDPFTDQPRFCCASIVCTDGGAMTAEQAAAILKWLSQMPPCVDRIRWEKNIQRLLDADQSEFADER